MSKRDEKAWAAAVDQGYRRQGIVALYMRTCQECGHSIACLLTDDAPTSCSEHS